MTENQEKRQNQFTKDEDYQKALTELETAIKEAGTKYKPWNKDGQSTWQRERAQQLDLHGDSSIYALIPENLGNHFIAKIVRTLKRNGIATKQDLANKSPEELGSLRNIGNQSTNFTRVLRDVAVYDFNRAQRIEDK